MMLSAGLGFICKNSILFNQACPARSVSINLCLFAVEVLLLHTPHPILLRTSNNADDDNDDDDGGGDNDDHDNNDNDNKCKYYYKCK